MTQRLTFQIPLTLGTLQNNYEQENIGSEHTRLYQPDFTRFFREVLITGVVNTKVLVIHPPSPPNGIGTIMSYCHVGGNGIAPISIQWF